jgi:hypothetical protein
VVICPYCRSAVARTDRKLEDLGKVAEIVESESPLKLGLKGTFNGTRFELTGRAQYRHSLGGNWDEWYATFSNGWVGWLAEAQGNFYITFFQPVAKEVTLPTFDSLRPGAALPAIPGAPELLIKEAASAKTIAAEGEIPYQFVPGEESKFADLVGKNNVFGTLDYSFDPPWLFVGKQVTLAEIGLGDAKPAEREARRVTSEAMGCPKCGGPLELRAPDKTERIACPYCGSLLDVNEGKLKYYKAAFKPLRHPNYAIEIGATGEFFGVTYKVIGSMSRYVVFENVRYFWNEYLLYEPKTGFRWLVQSDDHWSFVEAVNLADVAAGDPSQISMTVGYNGSSFKIFQNTTATVDDVRGEFYWRVEHGEQVLATDYVKPPKMLSCERTSGEVNWSLGTYLPKKDVEKAFGLETLPTPTNVAPNQPFNGSFFYTYGLLPVLLLFVIAVFLIPLTGMSRTVLSERIVIEPTTATIPLTPITTSPAPAAAQKVKFSTPFELKANRNVRITASAPVNNSAVDMDIDLINEQNAEIESVAVPVSYYHGVEGGESWSEGGQSNDATFSSLPAGKYTLRVTGTLEGSTLPIPVDLKVEQNVTRGVNFICALVLLLIFPVLGLISKMSFEGRRWSESEFGPKTSDE